jgi:hypothetical protein
LNNIPEGVGLSLKVGDVNDGFDWAIGFAGPTLDTQLYVDMRLGFIFGDGITWTACNAGAAKNTGIGNNIRH